MGELISLERTCEAPVETKAEAASDVAKEVLALRKLLDFATISALDIGSCGGAAAIQSASQVLEREFSSELNAAD